MCKVVESTKGRISPSRVRLTCIYCWRSCPNLEYAIWRWNTSGELTQWRNIVFVDGLRGWSRSGLIFSSIKKDLVE